MTIAELYQEILDKFYNTDETKELLDEKVTVTASAEPERTLRPENDPPSLAQSGPRRSIGTPAGIDRNGADREPPPGGPRQLRALCLRQDADVQS